MANQNNQRDEEMLNEDQKKQQGQQQGNQTQGKNTSEVKAEDREDEMSS